MEEKTGLGRSGDGEEEATRNCRQSGCTSINIVIGTSPNLLPEIVDGEASGARSYRGKISKMCPIHAA
jgi:hypothetical protein